MSDDPGDRVKPWTIKGIPAEARNAAIAAAERERQTLGEWMARAIRTQIQSDRQRDRAPTLVGPEPILLADLGEIERLIAATAELAQASGEPPPKAITRAAYGLLRSRIKASTGPTKPSLGRTSGAESLTDEAEGQTE